MGLDYMHRICKMIHTDLKPENITFAPKEEEEFDLLYTNVLTTPLINIFDQDKIILNKKQQKNQKKKDRKKKKKQQQNQQQVPQEIEEEFKDGDSPK